MISHKLPIITISGATGTGKTSSAILLAEKLKDQYGFQCEIVNFDSIQFYKDLNIASAKPSEEELARIPHHLINIKAIEEEMNASEFAELAKQKVSELHQHNIIPIMVGGSGFYLRAFVKGMFESQTVRPETRLLVENILEKEGSIGLRQRIKEVDPESFAKLHHNDNYRNSRALEHWIDTGTKFSEKSKSIADPFNFANQENPDYHFIHFYAFIEKDEHFPLLMQRTRSFFNQNKILDEVSNLLDKGYTGEEKSLQSIGYKETIQFLQNPVAPAPQAKEALIERIFISTRQLVKAQKTFFKKVEPKITFNPLHQQDLLVDNSVQFLQNLIES